MVRTSLVTCWNFATLFDFWSGLRYVCIWANINHSLSNWYFVRSFPKNNFNFNIRWPLTGQKGRSTHKTISRPYNSVTRCIPINSHFYEFLITDHSILVLAVVWSTVVGTVEGACVRWQNALNFWLLRWWSCKSLGSGSGGLRFESRRGHVGILRP